MAEETATRIRRRSPARERLLNVGYERLRVAVALLALSTFVVLYLLVAALAPPSMTSMMACLGACYCLAFFGLAAEWFWGRWVANGLGWSGATLGLFSLVMVGPHPVLMVYGGLHAALLLLLWGPKIAARYEQQPGWQARFSMDAPGVARVGRAVTQTAASLPSLIVWALGPKEGQGLGILVTALAAAGLWGLLRLRTWSLLAIGAAGLVTLRWAPVALSQADLDQILPVPLPLPLPMPLGGIWLLLAVVPFVLPLVRTWRGLPR